MLLSLVILFVLVYTVVKTFSYGIWCFCNKEVMGGVFITVLCVFLLFSGVMIFML